MTTSTSVIVVSMKAVLEAFELQYILYFQYSIQLS